jgi:hypothetical protein
MRSAAFRIICKCSRRTFFQPVTQRTPSSRRRKVHGQAEAPRAPSRELVYSGDVERLRQLFAEVPALTRITRGVIRRSCGSRPTTRMLRIAGPLEQR